MPAASTIIDRGRDALAWDLGFANGRDQLPSGSVLCNKMEWLLAFL